MELGLVRSQGMGVGASGAESGEADGEGRTTHARMPWRSFQRSEHCASLILALARSVRLLRTTRCNLVVKRRNGGHQSPLGGSHKAATTDYILLCVVSIARSVTGLWGVECGAERNSV